MGYSNISSVCIEEKQIGTNYEIVMAAFNNKITNKILVNFKFYNKAIYIY